MALPLPVSCTKISFKWNIHVKMKSKTILPLKDTIKYYLNDFVKGKYFFNYTKDLNIKEKIDGLDLINIKNFFSSKDTTIKRIERYTTECKKIFATHLTDRGLITKTHKGLLQINKIRNGKYKRCARDFNMQFTRKDTGHFNIQ